MRGVCENEPLCALITNCARQVHCALLIDSGEGVKSFDYVSGLRSRGGEGTCGQNGRISGYSKKSKH